MTVPESTTDLLAGVDRHGDLTHLYQADGTITDTSLYDPFGDPLDTTGTFNPTVGFQSDWTDPTTTHVWQGARWYQPAWAGFLSRDTIRGELATPVTLNRYTYANNSPLNYWDPDGRYAKDGNNIYDKFCVVNNCLTETPTPAYRSGPQRPPTSTDGADEVAIINQTRSTADRYGVDSYHSATQQQALLAATTGWSSSRPVKFDAPFNRCPRELWGYSVACLEHDLETLEDSFSRIGYNLDPNYVGRQYTAADVLKQIIADPDPCLKGEPGWCALEAAGLFGAKLAKIAKLLRGTRYADEVADVSRVLDDAPSRTARIGDDVVATSDDAFTHGYDYDARIRARGVQDPVGHNFPYSYDDVILRSSPVQQADGSLLFRAPGSINGKDGFFEIAVNPDTGTIFHRTFVGG